ncbi:MAG TPA: DUF2244 domain-containing protein [Rhizomicrobium sp.]|jgi:uncharacterized membrane protein
MRETGREPLLLDAVLRPNPPMSAGALLGILIAVGLINFVFGLSFLLRGAWPIMPFLGADVALLAWAFHASRVAARAQERVTLSPAELVVEHRSPKGAVSNASFNPYWVSVDLAEPADMPRSLTLRSHGKRLQIGAFLGPRERLSFAQALKTALAAARVWRGA